MYFSSQPGAVASDPALARPLSRDLCASGLVEDGRDTSYYGIEGSGRRDVASKRHSEVLDCDDYSVIIVILRLFTVSNALSWRGVAPFILVVCVRY